MDYPSVTCYPTPGKAKAWRLCDWFAQGVKACGGTARMMPDMPAQLEPGAAVFYGITPATEHLWRQAMADGRDWYFIDNSYFDCVRGTQFRVTRNRVQHNGQGASDGRRLAALGIQAQPWRGDTGNKVLICQQSDMHMRLVMGLDPGSWLRWAQALAKNFNGLPVIRAWNANKATQQRSFAEDLRNARVVITHSSAAAVEAWLAGVPIVCDRACAAYGIAFDDRARWAGVLADNQWTPAELQDGTAWGYLNERR